MKNLKKFIALAMITVLFCMSFAACGNKLSGTYSASGNLFGVAGSDVSYKFSGKKVTVTVTASVLGFEKENTYSGTYELTEEEGKSYIVFTFSDSEADSYDGKFSFAETENGIKISGVEYTKEK